MSTQGMTRRRRSPNRVIDGKKKCGKCGIVKPVDEFPKRKWVRQDGTVTEYPDYACKKCTQEYNRKYQSGNTQVHDTRRITRAVTGKTQKPRGPNYKYRKGRGNTKTVDATKFFEHFDLLDVNYVELFRNIGEDPSQLRVARRQNKISPRLADKVLTSLGQHHLMKVLGIE